MTKLWQGNSIKFLENTWSFWGLTAIAVTLLVGFPSVYADTIDVSVTNVWTEDVSAPFVGGATSGVDRAYYPSVVKVDSTYHLWYGDGANTRHATSTNADFNGFTFPAPAVTGLGGTSYHPFVLYSESGLTIGGTPYNGPFFMYSTNSGNWNASPIVSHSTDGDTWITIGSVTGVNSYSPNSTIYNFVVVYEDAATWKAYADNGFGHVVYYTSTDGLNWTGVSQNLIGDSLQDWETVNNTRPFVM